MAFVRATVRDFRYTRRSSSLPTHPGRLTSLCDIERFPPFPAVGRVYAETRLVGPGETATDGRARLDRLVDWMQAIAYADIIDAGLDGLVLWVVRRAELRVARFPRLGEVIEVRTSCSALGSRWAERRTSMPGVEASAVWVAIDPQTLRPARIDQLADVYGESAGDRRVRTGLTHPAPPADAASRPWPLRRSDLDVGGHVNNAAFLQALEEEDLQAPLTVEVEYHVPTHARTGRHPVGRRPPLAGHGRRHGARVLPRHERPSSMSAEMIDITTPDGVADAYRTGEGPGVLLLIDAFGLRPQIERMADRIAAQGYTVLAPNVFYRHQRGELLPGVDLRDPAQRDPALEIVFPLVRGLTPDMITSDAGPYLDQLPDGQAALTGYCMGGRLGWAIAASYGDRIAALGCFHTGGLVTDGEDSPHTRAGEIDAELYFGHADHDRGMTPENIAALDGALDNAGVNHTTEVYEGAQHGYTMADTAAYSEAAAERHFTNLFALLGRTL